MLLFFLTGILGFRLLSLEVFQGSYYAGLSESNRIHTTAIHAPRGIIYDRNGTPLVFNIPGFRQVINKKTTMLSNEEATKQIATGAKNIEIDNLREYPYKDALAHVVGYIGQITQDELEEPAYAAYKPGELLGKTGIEQSYEEQLRGIDGKELVEVDAMGKAVRKLGEQDPIRGKDITLTIDAKLQQAMFLAMKDVVKGAAIASTPTGEILAIVSKPSFDPNLFTLGNTYKTASDSAYSSISSILLDGSGQPLLDRAISGTYPPGSTFKLVTAATGLESKKIDENFTIVDTGILKVGAFSFGNWYFLQYGRTEGEINVVGALKRSNDIFFYKVAEAVGVGKLSAMAEKFGLGSKTGIDIYGEAKGVVPTTVWKEKVIGEPWYLGDTYHYGIGQGYLLTTPLQVNIWTQIIANGGTFYEPHFLKNQRSKIKDQNLIGEKTHALILQGMRESCSPGGVAWPFFDFKVKNPKLKIDGKNILEAPQATESATFGDYRLITVACKTGTAQHGNEETLPHAWITLFAPAYNPEIIVTVLSESSGEGSTIAGPIAKKILEAWFSR